MKSFPLTKIHQLLEPGPIVLLSTYHRGRSNVMTMGFHMMIQHAPPIVGAVVGPWDFTYTALKATRECVISVPGMDLAKKVVDIGNCSGSETDKFEKFGLTPRPAKIVQSPLIDQCLANIECRVVDTKMVNRYNLFILEAVKAWTNPNRKEKRTMHHQGNGTFKIDGKLIDYRHRMVKWRELAE